VNATQPANPASVGAENLAESPEFRAALANLARGSGRDEAVLRATSQ